MSARAQRQRCVRLHALAASLALALAVAPVAHASSASRPSLPTIERQVMCVTCKIPLNVAQSLQANREREFIQSLIDEGQSEAQIKRSLVAQYGPSVLGLPSTHGFDLTAYLVPLAVVLALMITLAALLPRWRRHARAQAVRGSSVVALSTIDAARLESDLARFD
ncbi:MAG TPA: cytochrome c-type biogenesis protein CcmH [Solirubrobacteraceae bacterium]|nr:cytochrome c-type biogenesis protein CcmH [Solirubrobacteraceae bacterium]